MLLKTADLKAWLGYERKADVIKWLDRNGVPWDYGKGGEICTTLDAITRGMEGGESRRQPARFA